MESNIYHCQTETGQVERFLSKTRDNQVLHKGKFLYSEGGEALALLPREVWVPQPQRLPRPSWMEPVMPEQLHGNPGHGKGLEVSGL